MGRPSPIKQRQLTETKKSHNKVGKLDKCVMVVMAFIMVAAIAIIVFILIYGYKV